MRRLIALTVAGMFDTVGSAASAFGEYCLAACECIGDAIELRDKEERRKARLEKQMSAAARSIESLPVAER